MTLAALAFLMTGVLLNAAAQLLLKAGTNALGVLTLTRENWSDTFFRMATEGHFVIGIACYALSVVVWIFGLSRVPVSMAYPLLSVGYVVNAVAAHFDAVVRAGQAIAEDYALRQRCAAVRAAVFERMQLAPVVAPEGKLSAEAAQRDG